jgi:mannitol operon transcriptional antiterminator
MFLTPRETIILKELLQSASPVYRGTLDEPAESQQAYGLPRVGKISSFLWNPSAQSWRKRAGAAFRLLAEDAAKAKKSFP